MAEDFFRFLETQQFYLIKLYITERCNLDCDYCYYKERGFIDANPEDVKYLLQQIPSENINGFVISGGEALLKWENFKEIVVYIRQEKNFTGQIILQTNGLLIDDQKIAFFKNNNIALEFGFDGAGISTIKHRLGLTQNTYQIVLNNILKVAKEGLTYFVSMTVFPQEADKLYQNFDFLWSQGVRNIDICPAIYEKWDEPLAKITKVKFLKVIKKLHEEGSSKISREFSQKLTNGAILILLPTGELSLNYFIMSLPTENRHQHRIAFIKDGNIKEYPKIFNSSLERYDSLFKKEHLTYMDVLVSSAALSYPEIKQKRGNLNFEIWAELMKFKQKSEKLLPILVKHAK